MRRPPTKPPPAPKLPLVDVCATDPVLPISPDDPDAYVRLQRTLEAYTHVLSIFRELKRRVDEAERPPGS